MGGLRLGGGFVIGGRRAEHVGAQVVELHGSHSTRLCCAALFDVGNGTRGQTDGLSDLRQRRASSSGVPDFLCPVGHSGHITASRYGMSTANRFGFP